MDLWIGNRTFFFWPVSAVPQLKMQLFSSNILMKLSLVPNNFLYHRFKYLVSQKDCALQAQERTPEELRSAFLIAPVLVHCWSQPVA